MKNKEKKRGFARGLCLLLLLTLTLGVLTSCGNFSYTESNLSDYVKISREDYMGLTVTVSIDPVSDFKVEEKILQLRYQNRSKTAERDGASLRNQTVTAGDVLSIYYQGYTVDENGKKTYLDNTCNFSGDLAELGIGSGSFVSGFEYGLLGRNPKDYSVLKIIKTGTISEDTILYADFVAYYPDGSVKNVTDARLDFSEDLDAEYGEGFREALLGKPIGTAVKAFTATLKTDQISTKVAYSDFTPNFRTTGEENPIVMKTRFPYNYQTESMRLKTVYFNVWIDSAVLYTAPEFDDAFVTDTLKMSEEDLAAFEGDTLTDRARASIRKTLEDEYEEGKRTLAEEELWKILKAKAQFPKLPKSAVEAVEQEYMDDLNQKYASYTENYGSSIGGLEAFAEEYYGLSDGTTYKEYIHSQAEDVVKEKLIFYDILRREEKLPTGEEFDKLYNQAVEDALNYYLKQSSYNKDSFESEEKYNEAVAALKQNILSYYGEDYFREQAYYEALLSYLIDTMTIKTTYPDGAL